MKNIILLLIIPFILFSCSSNDDGYSYEEQKEIEEELMSKINGGIWNVYAYSDDNGNNFTKVNQEKNRYMDFNKKINYQGKSVYSTNIFLPNRSFIKDEFSIKAPERLELRKYKWKIMFREIDDHKAKVAIDMPNGFFVYKIKRD